jgi:hypothetical protein
MEQVKLPAKSIVRRRSILLEDLNKEERRGKARKMTPRLYRGTLATRRARYDEQAGKARWFEAHVKVARYGNIDTVRRKLAERCIPVFQRAVKRDCGIWIPKGEIGVRFEREQPAKKIEGKMQIEMLAMEFRGRQREASRMPSKVFSYAKRRRRR